VDSQAATVNSLSGCTVLDSTLRWCANMSVTIPVVTLTVTGNFHQPIITVRHSNEGSDCSRAFAGALYLAGVPQVGLVVSSVTLSPSKLKLPLPPILTDVNFQSFLMGGRYYGDTTQVTLGGQAVDPQYVGFSGCIGYGQSGQICTEMKLTLPLTFLSGLAANILTFGLRSLGTLYTIPAQAELFKAVASDRPTVTSVANVANPGNISCCRLDNLTVSGTNFLFYEDKSVLPSVFRGPVVLAIIDTNAYGAPARMIPSSCSPVPSATLWSRCTQVEFTLPLLTKACTDPNCATFTFPSWSSHSLPQAVNLTVSNCDECPTSTCTCVASVMTHAFDVTNTS